MASRFHVLFILFATIVAVSSAGLLESLFSWDLPNSEARSAPQSKCLCQTSGCLCCVDLNLTSSIDLGGPACVNINQREGNVTLNLNYGDNPEHNATIKIADAANKPTCMNLLSDLAQICAKFESLKQAELGHNGCLVIEPALLGTPQATYPIGCFNFNNEVRQIDASIVEVPEPSDPSPDESEDDLNTDELIAAVSASAEKGIALFSQWLGLNLNPKLNLTTRHGNREEDDEEEDDDDDDDDEEEEKEKKEGQVQGKVVEPTKLENSENKTEQSINGQTANVNASSHRMSRTMPEDKTEEIRFKQLLSAQDNIIRHSATIGQKGTTNFVYSKPVQISIQNSPSSQKQANQLDAEQLTVVPRESRRGGRAYNIHQHVNEV